MAEARHYPSYKDLDDFIDVERLKSLDGFIAGRLMDRIEGSGDLRFYTGPFLLDADAPCLPGSKIVSLARSVRPDDYHDLDRTELWHPSPEAAEFAPLMDFIATLPFAATGRMIVMYDYDGRAVPAHRDHDRADVLNEFVWLRTNFAKPFFMLDPATGEKLYVASHSAWFDTVNQYHGADAGSGLSFSIRIDGRFTDEFRRLIPPARNNRSSAPALWAAAGSNS